MSTKLKSFLLTIVIVGLIGSLGYSALMAIEESASTLQTVSATYLPASRKLASVVKIQDDIKASVYRILLTDVKERKDVAEDFKKNNGKINKLLSEMQTLKL